MRLDLDASGARLLMPSLTLHRAPKDHHDQVPTIASSVTRRLSTATRHRTLPRWPRGEHRLDTRAQRRTTQVPPSFMVFPDFLVTWSSHQPRHLSHHLWCGCQGVVRNCRRPQVQRIPKARILRRRVQRLAGIVGLLPRLQVNVPRVRIFYVLKINL